MTKVPPARPDFRTFYATDYLAEHNHPVNLALHVIGTIGGIAAVGYALVAGPLWLALAWPLLHVLPGLAGHRLFERNTAVGDLRLTRIDYPLWWFVIANHILTARLLTGTFKR